MKQSNIPFKKMIFVCTHQRDGEESCGNAERGADRGENLVELLREEMKKRGLKGKIRVAKSGCMDVCKQGPNIMVFTETGEQVWYRRVTVADLPVIVEKYFKLEENTPESPGSPQL